MTIETRNATTSTQKMQQSANSLLQQQNLDSNSSTGYQDSPSEDDGYFTSAVSVQHKQRCGGVEAGGAVHEASSSSSCSTLEHSNTRKVVWPAPSRDHVNPMEVNPHHHHDTFNGSSSTTNGHIDRPMAWMKKVACSDHHNVAEAMEMEIQKRTWDATAGRRLSRSRSKSKHIMERARSFERAAAEAASHSNHSSRTPSRQGSFSNVLPRRRRSPSIGKQMSEYWQNEALYINTNNSSRPLSRSARDKSVGRVDTSPWENQNNHQQQQQQQPKTPPQTRKQLKAPSPPPREEIRPNFPRGHVNQWPQEPPKEISDKALEPPLPPPPPARQMQNNHENSPLPQPPPQAELSTASIQQLSQEDKGHIVEQWVRQTSSQQSRRHDELEKFAYDIAETVVTNMEKHNHTGLTVKTPRPQQQQQHSASSSSTMQTSSRSFAQTSSSTATMMQEQRSETAQMQGQQAYTGVVRATPAKINESNKQKLMEEEMKMQRRTEETRIKQHQLIEEKRRQEEEEILQRRTEETRLRKQQLEEKRRQEELQLRMEEEMEMQRRTEENRLRKQQVEEKRRQEESRRQEEANKRREEEAKKQELKRYEALKRQEKMRRVEEERKLQEEMTREYEKQEEPRRAMTPKIEFRPDPLASSTAKPVKNEHFSQVRTGLVNEKRHFWMRSISTDKLHMRHELSPGPRRRRMVGQEWIRAEQSPSRPGSSLGQAAAADQGGNVRNVVSGWGELSKSRSSAAVLMQNDANNRFNRFAHGGSVRAISRERQLQEPPEPPKKQTLDVHTNQVQDTVHQWGKPKHDTTTGSGRTTPVPSRHIAEVFADNKITATPPNEEIKRPGSSAPWRTKTPEPTLKIVNVSVERPTEKMQNVANVHFSQNAEAQMASFKESKQSSSSMMTSSTTAFEQQQQTTSSSSTSSSMQKVERVTQVPPKSPGPSRGGRTSTPTQDRPSSVPPKEKGKSSVATDKPKPAVKTGPSPSENYQGKSVSFHQQQQQQQQLLQQAQVQQHYQQKIESTHNSVISTSSGQIPMPVSQSWHEQQQQQQQYQQPLQQQQRQQKPHFQQREKDVPATTTVASAPLATNDALLIGKTPLPVLSGWFGEEQEERSRQMQIQQQVEEHSSSNYQSSHRGPSRPAIAKPQRQMKNNVSAEIDIPNKSSSSEDIQQETPPQPFTGHGDELLYADETTPDQRAEQKVLEDAMKGKVRENIAMFQKGNSFDREVVPGATSSSPVCQDSESMRGKLKQTRQAYLQQRTSSTDREESERQQRAKELQVIAQARSQASSNDEEDTQKRRDVEHMEARARMLQEVASLRSAETASSEEDGIHTSQERAAERARQERSRELAEIAELRGRTNWENVTTGQEQVRHTGRTPDPELEEARNTIRNAAAAWQEREIAQQHQQQQQQQQQQQRYVVATSGRDTPSRRIGNLFNRDSDHWNMEDDEFPDPPPNPDDFIQEETNGQQHQPPPPPRDSSKEYMMEFGSQAREIRRK